MKIKHHIIFKYSCLVVGVLFLLTSAPIQLYAQSQTYTFDELYQEKSPYLEALVDAYISHARSNNPSQATLAIIDALIEDELNTFDIEHSLGYTDNYVSLRLESRRSANLYVDLLAEIDEENNIYKMLVFDAPPEINDLFNSLNLNYGFANKPSIIKWIAVFLLILIFIVLTFPHLLDPPPPIAEMPPEPPLILEIPPECKCDIGIDKKHVTMVDECPTDLEQCTTEFCKFKIKHTGRTVRSVCYVDD